MIPGPPFLFGACAVILALGVAIFIPDHHRSPEDKAGSISTTHSQSANPLAIPTSDTEDHEPLLQDSSM